MTVHVNPITQAAPSQRRIISISEASNQSLFHYQKFSWSESVGGLISCSNRAHGPRNSQSRSTETVEVTAASWEADRLRRTSRACAEETAGEAAARREEDQHQTAAARDGERLDPVDNVGAFTQNFRDIRPVH